MIKTVYLAGPIAGHFYDEVNTWRVNLSQEIYEASDGQIRCYSPMRGQIGLNTSKIIQNDFHGRPTPLNSNRAIMTRDFNDCKNADLVFVNLFGSEFVSIGTMMEVGFAYAFRVPVVGMIEMEGGIYNDHPMLMSALDFRVTSYDEAVETIVSVLLP